MSTTQEGALTIDPVAQVALRLSASTREAYYNARQTCGKLIVDHDTEFGYFEASHLHDDEKLAYLISSMYGNDNLKAFQSANQALKSFNSAYNKLQALSGAVTTGDGMAGYYFGGPTDQLLRAVRKAVAISDENEESAQELARSVAERAEQLSAALRMDSDAERAAIHAEAEKLQTGPHESLEAVAGRISVPSDRRDKRAVAFVALALAGWEPDLDGWEKNVASVIRGEKSLRGEYRLPITSERAVQNDILVGMSLQRRDTYQTLDGTTLLRTETLHIGQDSECRFVRASEKPEEAMVSMMWAQLEKTPDVDWETVKEFVLQTDEIGNEWRNAMKRMMEIGKACVSRNGPETGRVFNSLMNSVKEKYPYLHKIWEKALTQRSFTGLTGCTTTTEEARAAVVERMLLSTVTDGTVYHIGSHPFFLRIEEGVACLFDEGGNKVSVDGDLESLNGEMGEVGGKFFGMVARALDGVPVKLGFYEDSSKQATALIEKGPREGLDRGDDTEDRVTRVWEQMCTPPFAAKSEAASQA